MEAESAELCGIPGNDDETLTKGEFNRLVTQVKFYHYRPQQKALKDLSDMLDRHHKVLTAHIEDDREFYAKLTGARWALYAIVGMLAPVIPILFYLIRELSKAGVL